MKLFTRYSQINLFASIAVFLVSSVAFYFSLRFVLIKEIDEDLEIEQDEISAYVQKYDRLPESFSFSDQVIHFTDVGHRVGRSFTTLQMIDEDDRKMEKFRRLSFGIRAGGEEYQADVSKSLEGTANLLRSILTVSISTILVILLVYVVINRVLLKRLWKPFYESINAVKSFRVSKNQPLLLPDTGIEEFVLLNKTLEGIADNTRLEYLSLKTFSENASHEFQTPIAIIRSKLDMLIQDEGLSQNQTKRLQSVYVAVEKLSRLNHSLLLLAKIESNQFDEAERIDLKQKIEEKLQDFQELWQSHSIGVHAGLQPAAIRMNGELADILLNNLLSNATNHNHSGGTILITLKEDELVISNSGNGKELDEEKIFQRFYKPSQGSSHNGLGLSIIKQIADVSGLDLTYQHSNGSHSFSITWNSL